MLLLLCPLSSSTCHLWWLQLYSVLTRSFLTSLFFCCSSIRELDYPLLLVAHSPSLMCVRQKRERERERERERKVMLLFSLFWWVVVVVVPNLSFLALFKIFFFSFQMELSSSEWQKSSPSSVSATPLYKSTVVVLLAVLFTAVVMCPLVRGQNGMERDDCQLHLVMLLLRWK